MARTPANTNPDARQCGGMYTATIRIFRRAKRQTNMNANAEANTNADPRKRKRAVRFFCNARGRGPTVSVQVWGDRLTTKPAPPQKPLWSTSVHANDGVVDRVEIRLGTSLVAQSLHNPVKFP